MRKSDARNGAARPPSTDEISVASLFSELHPMLLRYLRARASSAADDLAAETWLAVARILPEFDGSPDELRKLVFAIAHRRLVDHWRRVERQRTHLVPAEALAFKAAADDTEAEGLESVVTGEAVDLVASIPPPDQLDVLLLRTVGGLDAADVDQIVGKTSGAVRVIQHRALRRLRDALAEEAETPLVARSM